MKDDKRIDDKPRPHDTTVTIERISVTPLLLHVRTEFNVGTESYHYEGRHMRDLDSLGAYLKSVLRS